VHRATNIPNVLKERKSRLHHKVL